MKSLPATLGTSYRRHPLRDAFLRWQCRVRQIAMRENNGRPGDAITPSLKLPGEREPMGHIVTLICKSPGYSVTPELMHIARKSNDPAQRREQAIRFLSAAYFQKPKEFSDILTATFPPASPGATKIRQAGRCTLLFEAHAQRFELDCKVRYLRGNNPLRAATWWHNKLFNPDLHPDTEILGFEPDWEGSAADPPIA